MLPAHARLTRSQDYREVIRCGRRAGRKRLVVHAITGSEHDANSPAPPGSDAAGGPDRPRSGDPVRVGFVVSKAVGNSVVRHRVTRRLRHVVRDRLGTLCPGSALVVRALPAAATASSAELGQDFDAAVRRLRLVPTDDGGAV